jgi:hypothetical protein
MVTNQNNTIGIHQGVVKNARTSGIGSEGRCAGGTVGVLILTLTWAAVIRLTCRTIA